MKRILIIIPRNLTWKNKEGWNVYNPIAKFVQEYKDSKDMGPVRLKRVQPIDDVGIDCY